MLRRLLLILACVLTGLSAGFFYTFEASVTGALLLVDHTTYVETFQAINATIKNPWFGTVFFGSIAATVLAVFSHWKTNDAMLPFLLGALVLNLICLVITFTGNVPLNNTLATVTELTHESAEIARMEFESRWNQLHQWRTIAIVLGFIILVTGLTSSGIVTDNQHNRHE